MNLYKKIKQLYPSLTDADFDPIEGTIMLQDNSDNKGAYIAKWEHPTLNKPADEETE